jgi:hypothetical protein
LAAIKDIKDIQAAEEVTSIHFTKGFTTIFNSLNIFGHLSLYLRMCDVRNKLILDLSQQAEDYLENSESFL